MDAHPLTLEFKMRFDCGSEFSESVADRSHTSGYKAGIIRYLASTEPIRFTDRVTLSYRPHRKSFACITSWDDSQDEDISDASLDKHR